MINALHGCSDRPCLKREASTWSFSFSLEMHSKEKESLVSHRDKRAIERRDAPHFM